MVPDQLSNEIADLKKVGYKINYELVGNRIYINFIDFELPVGFNISKTDLLVWTNTSYPYSAFDMFWVDQSLLLENGQVPKATNLIQYLYGKKRRRFSIHPYQVKTWNPAEDSLEGFLTYINNRLNHRE